MFLEMFLWCHPTSTVLCIGKFSLWKSCDMLIKFCELHWSKRLFFNNSNLAVLAVLSIARRSQLLRETQTSVDPPWGQIHVLAYSGLLLHTMCSVCTTPASWTSWVIATFRRYFRLESGWKSIIKISETAIEPWVGGICENILTTKTSQYTVMGRTRLLN